MTLATRLALLGLVALGACDEPPPQVRIHAPVGGTVIDGHDPVRLDVEVRSRKPLRSLAVTVDGLGVAATISPPAETARCDHGCRFVVWLDAERLAEGMRRVRVTARDRAGIASSAERALRFEDAPQVHLRRPADGDALGTARLVVTAEVRDRSAVTGSVAIDGAPLPEVRVIGDCQRGCQIEAPWELADAAPGAHQVEIVAVDAHGRRGALRRDVQVGDAPYVRAIEITGVRDFRKLEIEVHLLDAEDGAVLGCAGRGSPLADVDQADVRYPMTGLLRRPDGQVLSSAELAGRSVRIVVLEDDFGPCPKAPGRGDDILGESPPLRAEALAGPRSFGKVVYLELAIGRPLH